MRQFICRFYILLLLIGCSPQRTTNHLSSTASALSIRKPIIGVLPNATVTLTPFLPDGSGDTIPTTTQFLNKEKPWGNFLGPAIWPPTEIPHPVGLLSQSADNVNILLLGDDKGEDESYRTDAVILLTLKPQRKMASIVSFPRDIYVYVPGWTMQRINVVMRRGGFELLATTFEYNFGVRPAYYARINFAVLKQVINDLGGIDIYLPQAMSDSVGGAPTRTVQAGMVHMDGEMVDWYLRARWESSDFDRTRRHQEILFAVFTKMISLEGLTHVNELYNNYIQNVDTNITIVTLSQWLSLAPSLQDSTRVEHFRIGEEHVISWTVPTSGSTVLLPNRKAIIEILKNAIEL